MTLKTRMAATGRICIGITALLSLTVHGATTSSWTKAGDGNWNDPANWDNGVPNGKGHMAILTNDVAAITWVTNDTSVTLGSLWIGPANTSYSFTITNTAPENILTFDNNGSGAQIIQLIPASSSANDRIYTPLILADNLTLTNVGPKYVQIYGTITESGGSKSITKVGSGNLTLSSTANSFSGGMNLKAGLLSASGNRAGTGPITVGDTNGSDSIQLIGSGSYTNAITVVAGSTGTKTFRAAGSSATVTFSGPIQLNNTLTVHGQSLTAHTSVSGPIAGDGAIRVTGTPPAYSTLSGNNSFTGGVTLESGILRAGTDTALGTGTLTLKAGTFAAGGTATRYPTNDVVISGNVQFGHALGTGNLSLGGMVDLGSTTRTITVSNTFTYCTNTVSGEAGIIKKGSGGLSLRGQSTFTGPITIQEGSVNAYSLGSYDPLGATPATPTTNLLVFDGGSLTFSKALFLSANRGIYITEKGGTWGGGSASGTGAIIAGPGNLTKVGTSSRLSISGANTFSGGLVMGEGKLRIGNDRALGTGTFTISNNVTLVNYYGTTRTLTNPVTVYGDFTFGSLASDEFGTLNFSGPWDVGATTRTITVPDDGVSSNVVSVISGPISGAGGVTKAGWGTLTLSGANTYTGPTLLSEGELTLCTAASGAGGITANDSTTLGIIKDATVPTLATPALALGNGGAGLTVAFFLPSGASAVPVVEATSLTVLGTVGVQIYGGGLAAGQYPLIKYTSPMLGGGSFAATPLHLPAGVDAQIVNNTANSSIDLKVNSVAATSLKWAGAINQLWDLSTLNWTDSAGAATFSQGASVTIDDTAVSPLPTVVLAGVMQPSAVAVNNALISYTMTGAGSLGGAMGLTKTGTNMLTISSANTYSGGTTVNEGILRVFNLVGSATGSGAVAINTGASLLGNGTIGGAVTVNNGASLAIGTTALGTMTINNSLNLASGSSTFLRLDKAAGTNDVIVAGATTFAGTLTVTNLSEALAGGETFKLFSTSGQSGNFSEVVVLGGSATGQFDPASGVLTISGGMATTPTNISFSFSNGNLSLTWPESYKGWYAQSNSVSIANSAAWFDIPGSETGTSLNIPVAPSVPNVFYRLRKP
jgi:fibronectin-binding autotransporter adhesin